MLPQHTILLSIPMFLCGEKPPRNFTFSKPRPEIRDLRRLKIENLVVLLSN